MSNKLSAAGILFEIFPLIALSDLANDQDFYP